MARRDRGFTLIEILVVITIIAGLMGLSFVLLRRGTIEKEKLLTKTRRDAIAGALFSLAKPELLGDYPPADVQVLRGVKGEMAGQGVGRPNDTNLGIESLYVAVFLQGHEVKLEYDDKWIGNTDGDNMSANPTRTGSNALNEFVDAWGNPYAYFSGRELKNPLGFTKYVMKSGDAVEAKPHVSESTKLPLNQGTFQLFSAGPDGVFNTADDIGNW